MIQVKTFVIGDISTNTYLIKDLSTGTLAVVDPAQKCDALTSAIEEWGGQLSYILLTHGHFDHIGFVPELCRLYSPKVLVGENELGIINSPEHNLSAFHYMSIDTILIDRPLKDGDVFTIGDTTVKYLSTPGHTAGSGCFVIDDCIFSGDTLFCESFGRTDFPTGDFMKISSSVRRLLSLDGDYTVYPGHDVSTTLSHERKYNPLAR